MMQKSPIAQKVALSASGQAQGVMAGAEALDSRSPVRGARALYAYHLALFTWWAFLQTYFHLIAPHISLDATFPMYVISLGMVATSLLVTSQFGLGRRGTPAAALGRVAILLAACDLFAETLQFAPRLGLPALMPSSKDATELVVREVWATLEFGLRSTVFFALWRSQVGADKRLLGAFVGLIGVHWALAMISFARATITTYAAFWNAQTTVLLLLRTAPLFGLGWLLLLVWLSKRVASGRYTRVTSERQPDT